MSFTLLIRQRGVKILCDDLAAASRIYSELRDASGEGMRTWPDGTVLRGRAGEVLGTISYNGRIWSPGAWKSGARPIFDPSACDEAAA